VQNPFADLVPGQSAAPPGPVVVGTPRPRQPAPRYEDEAARAAAEAERSRIALERDRLLGTRAPPPAGFQYSADGARMEPVPGGPADPSVQQQGQRTEGQRMAEGFYRRALNAHRGYGPGVPPRSALGQSAMDILPDNWENSLNSEDRRQANTYADEFIAATLRRESGAAIPPEEREAQYRRYFPVPGDTPQTIEIKGRLRQEALEALRIQASIDEPSAEGEGLAPGQFAPYNPGNQSGPYWDETGELHIGELVDPSTGRSTRETDISGARGGGGVLETIDSAVRGAADVLTLGFADEIAAAGDTIFGGGTMEENLRRQRAIDSYDSENHFLARTTGQFGGGFALPVGQVNSLGRMAGVGAGYGAGYGFGSGEGNVGDRAVNALMGGTIGAVAAPVAGVAINALGRGASRAANALSGSSGAERQVGQEAFEAAQRQGIDILPADVGGPTTRRLTAGAAQLPFASGPIVRAAQNAQGQAGRRLSEIAGAEGAPQRQEVFGETAQRAADRFVEESGQAGSAMYSEARDLSRDVIAQAPRAFQNLNAQIRELAPTGEVEAPLIAGLERFRRVIADDAGLKPLDIDSIRRLRTAISAEARTDGLRGTDYQRRAGAVLNELREDIAARLPARAAEAFRKADDAWRERLGTIDQVVEAIVGPTGERSAERVAQRLVNMGRNDSRTLTRFLAAVPIEEARVIRGSLIQELGRARDSAQNMAGDAFSFETFLTNWSALPERTRNTLFSGGSRAAIDDLVRVAEGARQTNRFANTSNTGGAGNVGETARALSYGAGWLTAGGSIILENVTGRMLASPRLTRWLARRPRNAQEAREHVARLSGIAAREPAIATEVLGLQRALVAANDNAAGVAGRSAASDPAGQNGREEQNPRR
jgi:hypothetical protein